MNIRLLLLVVVGCLLTVFVQAEEQKQADIPDWVLMPMVENSLSATSCNAVGTNINVSKKMAQSNALVDISMQIQTQISTIFKDYTLSYPSGEMDQYQRVGKELVKEVMKKVTVIKSDVINVNGENSICVQVALAEKELIEQIKKILTEQKK